ncbi:hypothetical protein OIU78_000634 [Salix suchowensis]|nr:hypothetical protein OIU78_000634 [Salix suchowensis]
MMSRLTTFKFTSAWLQHDNFPIPYPDHLPTSQQVVSSHGLVLDPEHDHGHSSYHSLEPHPRTMSIHSTTTSSTTWSRRHNNSSLLLSICSSNIHSS